MDTRRLRRVSRGEQSRHLRPRARICELRAGGARFVHGRGNGARVPRSRHWARGLSAPSPMLVCHRAIRNGSPWARLR